MGPRRRESKEGAAWSRRHTRTNNRRNMTSFEQMRITSDRPLQCRTRGVVPVGREEMEALKKRVPSHDGFGRRESRQKGRWITAQILHRLCPDLSSRTVSAQRTESHTISILPLPVDARITLQKLINTHNSTGMKNELEASRGKEEGGPKVDSGTRGREFESHRPDHF